ncbi:MAG TPA: DNA polymerase III subunit delta' [Nitrolancea sp.]|nr:DNA polymerase III subunit delta' [Nitrolancea sp.]
MSAPAIAWPIIGHQSAVELLQRSITTGQIGHAYLLSGPQGIGRRTLARTFAQALVCEVPLAERPCGVCSACRRIARGIHPDVMTVSLEQQAATEPRDSKNTRITIDTIRELRSNLALRPLEAEWRVAILEDVELFSLPAYDALLKTLEEPPPFVVLLLIATELEAVPETIRSRCRPLALEPLSRAEVRAALTARGVEPEQATLLSGITRGRIGQAIALADDRAALEARRESVDAGLEMIENPVAALGTVRRMTESFRRGQRARVESDLDTLLGLWRDLLLIAVGCAEQIVNVDTNERLQRLARFWTLSEIHDGLTATHQALVDLSLNVQPRLALDRMVTQWPRPTR